MASSSITRVCLICNKKNDSLDLLRKHVKEEHPRAMFTACLKSRFVSQATEAYCGGQTQVFDKILIPEVAAVFGHGDSDAYYGMPENDGCGIDEEQQEKADLKTPPSTYVEVIDRLIGSQDEMPVSEMREPLDDYPVNEDGDDDEVINVNMSYEEGVLTQADNVDFCFDYDQAIKEMAARDEAAAELVAANPYSPIPVPNSPRLPIDEFAEVKKVVTNCQDQVAQHFKILEECFKAMPDKSCEVNAKKFSRACLLMHKAEKVFGLLDRVLENDETVWDDEVSDLELERVLDATQKQIIESDSPPLPSLLALPAAVVIEDPVGLNFTQSQALDYSKSVSIVPKVVKDIVQSQAYDFSVKKARCVVDAELPSTSANTTHSFVVPSKPMKRALHSIPIYVPEKVAKVVVSNDDDDDGERIRPKAFSIVRVPRIPVT